MNERVRRAMENILNRPNADPDDDAAILARLAAAMTTLIETLGYQQRPRWWDRGAWEHYTTHQVSCPAKPWSGNTEALCTCGYTRLVDAALRAEATDTLDSYLAAPPLLYGGKP